MNKIIPIPAGATDLNLETFDPVVKFTIPDTPNKPPTITDGVPATIQLPLNEVILSAAASDLDGLIVSVKWEQISGPACTIADASLLTTKAAGLKEGSYLFRVTVTDDDGATASSTRSVTVKAAVVIPPVQDKVFPITSTPVQGDYPRPFAGAYEWNGVPWDGQQALRLQPSPDTYQRMNWFDFETTQKGVYNWTKFDAYIKAAISKGQKFYWGGVMPICQGCSGGFTTGGAQLGYPEWLHKEMMSDSNVVNRPWIATDANCWVPNWNSNIYLTAWENLLLAIAARLKANNLEKHISCIDIRGYGNWGEWHTYPWYWHQPKGTTATVATLKRIVDAHIKAFPNIPLVIVSAAYDPGNASLMPAEFSYYALTAKNNWGPIGWRRDNWGAAGSDNHLVNNPASWNGVPLKSLIMEKWKTSIVTGEPTADNSEVKDYYDLMREVALYHPVNIGNGNYASSTATAKANLTAAYALTGYRISVDGGSVAFKDRLFITTNWNNSGVSPTYEDWKVEFSIDGWKGVSKFNPKLLYGKLTFVDDFDLPSIPPGTYQLTITVTDPTGVRKPLPLNSTIKCEIKL